MPVITDGHFYAINRYLLDFRVVWPEIDFEKIFGKPTYRVHIEEALIVFTTETENVLDNPQIVFFETHYQLPKR